jgi:hypothetical protein
MGLTNIFKGLLAGGAAVAAPFTGGTSLAALPAILGGASTALGAFGQGKAQNRDAQFSGQQDLAQIVMANELARAGLNANSDRDYFDQTLQREQEGRAGRKDAWAGLMSAQHTLNPGARPQLAGPYNVAPRQASDAERTGASAMSDEVMARLQGGNPMTAPVRRPDAQLTDPRSIIDQKLLKPGGGEQTMGILGPILAGLGIFTQGRNQPQSLNQQAGASKSMPVRYS